MRTTTENTSYMRAYRAKNRKKVNAYNREWMRTHRILEKVFAKP